MAKRSKRSAKSQQMAAVQALFRRCHRDLEFRAHFVATCHEQSANRTGHATERERGSVSAASANRKSEKNT
jgi:hypothetical protein